MYLAVRSKLGIELDKGDDVPPIAEGDLIGAGGVLDDGVDGLRPGLQLPLGDGVLLGNDLHADGKAMPRRPLQGASDGAVNAVGDAGQELRYSVKAIVDFINGDGVAHSSIASSSTRSIPISQTEEAT